MRFTFTALFGVLMGAVFWQAGSNRWLCTKACTYLRCEEHAEESTCLLAVNDNTASVTCCRRSETGVLTVAASQYLSALIIGVQPTN